jgi:hypothetical protein
MLYLMITVFNPIYPLFIHFSQLSSMTQFRLLAPICTFKHVHFMVIPEFLNGPRLVREILILSHKHGCRCKGVRHQRTRATLTMQIWRMIASRHVKILATSVIPV